MTVALSALGLVLLAFGGYGNTLPFVPINLILVGAVLTALTAAWAFIQDPKRANPIVPALALALAFAPGFILADDSTLYGIDKFRVMATLVPLTLFGSILLLSTTRRRAALIAAIAGWGLFIVAAQVVFPDPTVSARGGLALIGSNYISYGRAAGAAAVALIALSIYRVRFRWLYLVVGVALLGETAVSGSRGALAATVLAVLAAILFSRIPPLLAVLGICAGWVALQLVDLQSFLPERVQSLTDESTELRADMVRHTAEHALEHPFGTGWGSLAWEMRLFGVDLFYPHNVFVEVAGEAGLLAALGLVAIIFLASVRLLRSRKSPMEGTLFALLVFFVASAAVSSDIAGNRGLWLLIGAGLAATVASATRADNDGNGESEGEKELRTRTRRSSRPSPNRHRLSPRTEERPGGRPER